MHSHGSSKSTTTASEKNEYFQAEMQHIIEKLKCNPGSITTEDARRLSEMTEARDLRSAKIISAVEAFAAVNEEIHGVDVELGQAPHTSLLTVVKDLQAVVELSPEDVTPEILRSAQTIVSKMQRAVAHQTATHPELEAELQSEIANIEPKVASGTVTRAEANHLHSLEARAHGHTVKGGIAATAQSIAARRENQMSHSDTRTGSGTRPRADSQMGQLSPGMHTKADKEAHSEGSDETVKPKMEQDIAPPSDAEVVHSRERAHELAEKSSRIGTPQSLASKKRQDSMSDRSNVSPRASEHDYERRREQSHHDKEVNFKMAEMTIGAKLQHERENVSEEDAAYVQSREQRAHGAVEKGGVAAEVMAAVAERKRENSNPTLEVK